MSTIINRIATVFTAEGGAVKAEMRGIESGMLGIGRAAMRTNQQTGILTNQFRALATTFRYMVAGNIVFGGFGLVRSLSQIQTQMAMIKTLAPDMNFAGRAAGDFFDQLQRGSMASLTPLDQLGESTINLLSSVQGVKKSELAEMVTDLAEGAQLAQTPVDEITKAVTGMVQAFQLPPTRENFNKLLRDYITLIRRAPGGPAAGQQIIQQLAPLAAVSRLANVSPQQMFGLMTTSLRFGGTPATAGRGLQFLLQSISAPHKQERGALAQAGVTPEFVQQFGGLAAIRAVMRHARGLGIQGAGNLRGLPDETIDSLDTAGMAGLKDLGVSGRGIEWLQKAIGRIHGVRNIITLMTQATAGPAGGGNFAADIEAADRAFKGIGREGAGVEAQFRDFARDQPLKAAGIALHNIALEAPRALEGLINPVARQVAGLGTFAMRHPQGTRTVMQGAAAFMAAMGLARGLGALRGGGGIRGFFGALGRFGGQRFVQERALEAATNAQRAGVLGGSPQNPLYVTVVGQLFGGQTPGPGGGGILGDVEKGAKKAPWWARLNRFGALGKVGLGVAGIGAAAEVGATFAAMKLGEATAPKKDYSWGDLAHDLSRPFRGGGQQQQQKVAGVAAIDHLNNILRPFHRRDPIYEVTRIYSQRKQMIHGKAEITLNVDLMTSQGKVRKTIHVPMNLIQNSNGVSPSQRGQPGKTKANVP